MPYSPADMLRDIMSLAGIEDKSVALVMLPGKACLAADAGGKALVSVVHGSIDESAERMASFLSFSMLSGRKQREAYSLLHLYRAERGDDSPIQLSVSHGPNGEVVIE